MENEIWKPIIHYEWLYEISNLWRVKSLHFNNADYAKILKNSYSYKMQWKKSYQHVKLRWHSVKVHRLVALHFVENNLWKPCVNHIDGNIFNNHADNLEWVTPSENTKHAFKIWLIKPAYWENHHQFWKRWSLSNSAKAIQQFSLSGEFIRTWWSITEASLFISNTRNPACISRVCRWIRKQSHWFVWKFL